MRVSGARMFCLSALVVIAGCRQQPSVEPATLVLRNGTIVTVDAGTPQVQAIAVRGDTIAALGSNDEM